MQCSVRESRIFLAFILFIAAVPRLYDLAANPPEIFSDELNLYVSTRSIFTTGHDLDGQLHPFLYSPLFRNPPMYGIASYLSSLVLGNSPFGLRFPAVAFGLISIVLLYAIILRLTGRRDIALLTAFFLAIEPIFIHFSHVGWEPASVPPFLFGGLYALLCAIFPSDRNGPQSPLSFSNLAIGCFLLGASAYTYPGALFYATSLGGMLILLNFERFRSLKELGKVSLAIGLGVAVSMPSWPMTYDRVMMLVNYPGDGIPTSLGAFIGKYIPHFQLSYLIGSGAPDWKYLHGYGEFYWWTIPLCIVGVAFVGWYLPNRRMCAWLLFWLAIYPMGGALTGGVPNTSRTFAVMPIFCILAAIGCLASFDWLKGTSIHCRRRLRLAFPRPWAPRSDEKFEPDPPTAMYRGALKRYVPRCSAGIPILVLLLVVNVIASVSSFWTFYFVTYPRLSAGWWDSGTRAAFLAVRENAPGYSRVCFGNFSHWRIGMYIAYYIDDLALRKIEGVDDPACFRPGTLLVQSNYFPIIVRPGFMTIAYPRTLNGDVYALVQARPPILR